MCTSAALLTSKEISAGVNAMEILKLMPWEHSYQGGWVCSPGFSGHPLERWTVLKLVDAGAQCSQYSWSEIFWHAHLAQQNLKHWHWNTLKTYQFWWNPPRNQADAGWHPPHQQVWKLPYLLPSPGRVVGWWQAADRGCQAPVSWVPGSRTSQGFPVAGVPCQQMSPGSSLERAHGWPAYSVKSQGLPTSPCRRQIPIFVRSPSLLELDLIEACFFGWVFCFLASLGFKFRISLGIGREVSSHPFSNNFL